MGRRMSMPTLVNAHTHSHYGPHMKGAIPAQSFESYMVDVFVRYFSPETPEEAIAFATMTGLENLCSGHSAVIDSTGVPMSEEYLWGVARAYEGLGLYGWIFPNIADLPLHFYTREAYPRFPKAIPVAKLPDELQELCMSQQDSSNQLDALAELIRKWQGSKVKIGVGLTNPVWCSDELLLKAGELVKTLNVPVSFHVEESPLQHIVHQAQWGMSGIQRLNKFGLLGRKALLVHAVQIDQNDIALIAEAGSSVCHNPISNLKLRNGIAPVGDMISAGINVCLGTDGHSVSDVENLFPVMKFATSLADLNGISNLETRAEDVVLRMATENGYSLWFEGDFENSWIEFSSPIGPYGHIWDTPKPKISEVYVDGKPRLMKARAYAESKGVFEIVENWTEKMIEPGLQNRARSLANWVDKTTKEMM